jgi:tRNA A37 threonylcarbamoyladenosine modification protein TsaB
MKILTVENVPDNCGFLLQFGGNLIDKQLLPKGDYHSDELIYCLEEFLNKNKLDYSDIDALSLTKGPGNFTMLKALMTFAKGFRSCFPAKPIITNNLFELLTFEENYDKILLDVNENTIYIFDGTRYYFTNKTGINTAVEKNGKIITNSHFLLDLLKNSCRIVFRNFDEGDVMSINCKKFINKEFDYILEPLYIREPAINLKKK